MKLVEGGSAKFSKCGRYRYVLARDLRPAGSKRKHRKVVCFVMLNPSTAGAFNDDATIRRCAGFARLWGGDKLVVVNMLAYCSTDPKVLLRVKRPCGLHNEEYVRRAVRGADVVVCAWGNDGQQAYGKGKHTVGELTVMRWLRAERVKAKCLGTTRSGAPRHPVRLPYATKLEPFSLEDPFVSMKVPIYTGRGVEWV